MKAGPDTIIACPHCQGLGKYIALLSGNTLGAHVWTDGKQIALMHPRPPAVVRCYHCAECYWLIDARKVDPAYREDKGLPADPAQEDIKYVEEPTEEEYYSAIEKNLARNRKQERLLRILAWWRGNDAFREQSSVETRSIEIYSAAYRHNLKSLAELLNIKDEDDLIMKAEVMRELGQFEAAVAVLSRIVAPEYADVVWQLRSLCDSKDTGVRELDMEFRAPIAPPLPPKRRWWQFWKS